MKRGIYLLGLLGTLGLLLCLFGLANLDISTPDDSSNIRAFISTHHIVIDGTTIGGRPYLDAKSIINIWLPTIASSQHEAVIDIVEEATLTKLTNSLEFGTVTTCDDKPLI